MTIKRTQVNEWREVQRDIGRSHRHFGRPFTKWHLFDAYMGTGKPDMGLPTVHLLTGDLLWPEGTTRSFDTEPDEAYVRALVAGQKYWSTIGFENGGYRTIENHDVVVLDIECWPEETRYGHDEIQIARTAERYLRLIRAMRREADLAGIRIDIGIFGYAGSTRDYYGPLYPEYNVTWERWLKDCGLLAPLAQAVDFICPELYALAPYAPGDAPASDGSQRAGYATFADEWMGASANRLAWCSRYGKPVIPFISPFYAPGGKPTAFDWTEIEPKFWRTILTTVRANADGAVLWGGWKGDGFAEWSPGQWWPTTKEIIR